MSGCRLSLLGQQADESGIDRVRRGKGLLQQTSCLYATFSEDLGLADSPRKDLRGKKVHYATSLVVESVLERLELSLSLSLTSGH